MEFEKVEPSDFSRSNKCNQKSEHTELYSINIDGVDVYMTREDQIKMITRNPIR